MRPLRNVWSRLEFVWSSLQPPGTAHADFQNPVSAVRGALLDEFYQVFDNIDVMVVGGGPIGLAAAVHAKQSCARCLVAVFESGAFFNSDGSTTGLSRQTRIAYTTETLTKLAVDQLVQTCVLGST